MSQWGAYGYAQHGWTYDRILAHYYTGTALGPGEIRTLRVLVGSARAVKLSSTVAWTVTDAGGTKVALDPGTLVLRPSLVLQGGPPLLPPLTFASAQPLAVGAAAYRGRLVVSTDGKVVQVVDVVGLEQYLKGVVPMEMPSNWPAEALKAQAVAARSYALANLNPGRNFDLYGDARDQVYGGVASEAPTTNAASDATRGRVVLYDGKVADAMFFSTSGGRTASALEAIGTDVPYLVPVADPYDAGSPVHDWGPVLVDAAAVAKRLKLTAPIAGVEVADGQSGRVDSLTFTAADDSQTTLGANRARAVLGLRSTWFTPTLLELTSDRKAMTYGGAVSLTGRARGVDTLALEAKTAGSPDWSTVGNLALGADGSFSTIVRPEQSTQYRLAWGGVHAAVAKISVAPRIDAAQGPAGVTGTERPGVPNAPVQLQQQAGAAWTTIASTTTDAAGAWSFAAPLSSGAYRVRCAPGHGLAAGVSTTLLVQ